MSLGLEARVTFRVRMTLGSEDRAGHQRDETPHPWPQARVIQAALRGTHREVFNTEDGDTFYGVRSLAPWVFLAFVFDRDWAVLCSRCAQAEPLPPPPQAQTGSGVAQGDLFGVLTRDYAMYALTTLLVPFFRKHEDCKRSEPKPASAESGQPSNPDTSKEVPAA